MKNFVRFFIAGCFLILTFSFCGCVDNISDNDVTSHETTENQEKLLTEHLENDTTLNTDSTDLTDATIPIPEKYSDIITEISFSEEKTDIFRDKTGSMSGSIIRKTMKIKSIYGSSDDEMSFYKPVLSGETEAIAKINALFDEEEQGFFYGSENSLHFKEGYFDKLMYQGFSWYCRVRNDVRYIGNNIFSVYEWLYFPLLEDKRYGITFDTTTGNILPINYFINEPIDEFNEKVISLILNDTTPDSDSELVRGQCGDETIKNLIKNYSFADYEYYYDGKNLNLIFPEFGLCIGSKEKEPYIMQIEPDNK